MPLSELHYLARDKLYHKEKPYRAEFQVTDGVSRTNYVTDRHIVKIEAVRDRDRFDLNRNGFCFLHAKTDLRVEDALGDFEAAHEAYMYRLAAILQQRFPEYSRVEPFEYVARKRDARFPSDTFAIVTHQQPATLAHVDFSVNGADLQLKSAFPGQEEFFQGRDYDMLNVWRPLIGPNNDWPLALCDFTTIDPADTTTADLLYLHRVGENRLLHHNDQHRWYYIEQQQPEDLAVFRNTDSTGLLPYAFHCAFNNPSASPQGPPRQSCEVRFVAFR